MSVKFLKHAFALNILLHLNEEINIIQVFGLKTSFFSFSRYKKL